jgi:predicted esterase
MKEHHITIPRTARYLTLGDPAGDIRRVGFVCHGYRQLAARFLRSFAGLDDGRHLIVAPEGLSRFYIGGAIREHGPGDKVGATWMTREDRLSEISDYVGYLDAVYAKEFEDVVLSRVEVFVLGFSQGAHTASRWAVQGQARINHLVLWGGSLPPDTDIDKAAPLLAGMRLSIVFGTKDDLVPPGAVARTEAWLGRHGIAYELVRYDGAHEIASGALRRVIEG